MTIRMIRGSPGSTSTEWMPTARRLSTGMCCNLLATRKTRPLGLRRICPAPIRTECSETECGGRKAPHFRTEGVSGELCQMSEVLHMWHDRNTLPRELCIAAALHARLPSWVIRYRSLDAENRLEHFPRWLNRCEQITGWWSAIASSLPLASPLWILS